MGWWATLFQKLTRERWVQGSFVSIFVRMPDENSAQDDREISGQDARVIGGVGLKLREILPMGEYEALFSVPTTEQYAASIVEKYHVAADPGSAPHRAVDEVVPLLKQWAKQYLLGITLSGAYAKNTAITLTSHADVLISLSPVPNMELRGVYWNLFEFLTEQNLKPNTRNVSIHLPVHGLWVDLVPAYRDHGIYGNILFNKKTGETVHTDVAKHIHLVANSGRQQEISAVKIWRERNRLDFPSLYLELTVLRALEGVPFGQLAENVLTVFRYLSHHFERAVVADPGNAKNIVSGDISEDDKKAIAAAAGGALYEENWKKIIW